MNEVVTQIRTDIAGIEPFDALERAHQTDASAWIDSGAPIFRIQKPDVPLKHLVAYLVVVDPDHQSLLLSDHIIAELWLPNGGHVEQNELPSDTVRRESIEELRRKAVFLRGKESPFFITETTTVGTAPGHTDVDLWYLLRGDIHDDLDFDRREYRDMAWFTFDEVLQSHPAIFDEHMHRFTQKLVQYLVR